MPISKKPRKKKKPTKASKSGNIVPFSPLTDPRGMEGFMANLFGAETNTDPINAAQNIMYDAWDASDPKERLALARKALQISPHCADAYVLLAEETSRTREEALAYYQQAVDAAVEALGPSAFEEYTGRFWGFLETRPYMRARAGLAEALWATGEKDAAIQHFKEILELNPGDNQGIRYILAAKLLDIGRMADLKMLLEVYKAEFLADVQYTRALVAYVENESDAVDIAQLAWKANQHVPGMLSGRTPMIGLTNYITMGGQDEASSYIEANGKAWSRTPGAIKWLEDATKGLPTK